MTFFMCMAWLLGNFAQLEHTTRFAEMSQLLTKQVAFFLSLFYCSLTNDPGIRKYFFSFNWLSCEVRWFFLCLFHFFFADLFLHVVRQGTTQTVCYKFLRELFFVSVDSRSHAMFKMGASEGLEGRTKVLSDDKFRASNKALKIDKKKPQGMTINIPMKNIVSVLQRCFYCRGTDSAIISLGTKRVVRQ